MERWGIPSLSPGLFTKFLGSCLISVENWERFSEAREVKALLWRQIVTLVIVFAWQDVLLLPEQKKIRSASSYQKYFAGWT